MSAEQRAHIEALLRAGLSNLEIHRRTGAARTTVARHRRRLGLPGYHTTPDSPNCRHGHPFPLNLGSSENGHLICLECRRRRQREQAARAYVPAQPDVAAIERTVAGDPPARLTPRERHAAIHRLDRWGLSAAVIAERVRCSKRTVHRARAAA
ncbi:hypothetical protein SGFS_013470 [Streptomyces graminofaciens]|uniref:Uncharacterized protein n=1 Tax=Streptomyces graminofaciens TaxID=68212 RepID=A0ABM7F2U1_9ACTN|nr:helix-turn-helix domain-containing protein [Streptomyces graminofaciens]BBC30053.1 hypothetical protein SGFS_013470 [Streptomyces graminofaciens]